jgi:hypothetical protein
MDDDSAFLFPLSPIEEEIIHKKNSKTDWAINNNKNKISNNNNNNNKRNSNNNNTISTNTTNTTTTNTLSNDELDKRLSMSLKRNSILELSLARKSLQGQDAKRLSNNIQKQLIQLETDIGLRSTHNDVIVHGLKNTNNPIHNNPNRPSLKSSNPADLFQSNKPNHGLRSSNNPYRKSNPKLNLEVHFENNNNDNNDNNNDKNHYGGVLNQGQDITGMILHYIYTLYIYIHTYFHVYIYNKYIYLHIYI